MDAVTVLGTGRMGSALARSLVGSGRSVTVWNRTPVALQGATTAPTVAAAVRASPLAVLCVTDFRAVRAVLDAAGDALSGRVLVNLTTGTPEEANEVARWAAERGANYVGGVVHAAPAQIGDSSATLLVSGTLPETHRTTLAELGQVRLVGADPSAASRYDLALLGLWYDAQVAYLDALATVAPAGVDPVEFAPFAARQLAYVVDGAEETAREMAERRYPRGPASLAEHAPVLDKIVALRRRSGLGADRLAEVAARVRDLVERGHGTLGFTRLAER